MKLVLTELFYDSWLSQKLEARLGLRGKKCYIDFLHELTTDIC